MEEDKTFEIIESRVEAKAPIPSGLRRRTDGFSRQDVVNAFQNAFTMIGGTTRFALWAHENPDKFFPLYSRLLPSAAINIGDNATVIIEHALPQTPLDEHPTTTQANPDED